MATTVTSRVHRTIKDLPNYNDLTGNAPEFPEVWEEVNLHEGESLIGYYDNHPGSSEERVVITGRGLHVRRNQEWVFIKYNEIDFIETPESKEHVSGLRVQLADGSTVEVPVRGKRGKFRDAFQFLRFLNRVSQDQREST